MATRYIIRKRSRYHLVLIEIVGLSIYGAYWFCKRYGWDWIVGIAIFLAFMLSVSALFFWFRFFRYLFAVAFSFCWGTLAYGLASEFSKSELSLWVAFLLIFLLSLTAHRSYFNFTKNSERIDYME